MIEIKPATTGLSKAVEPILRALPQWFGIEEATLGYIASANTQPTLLAVDTTRDSLPVGFLTLLYHSPVSAEIYVMGVLPGYHRQGIGRALVENAENEIRRKNVKFFQVKTLSDRHPDAGYAKTRLFYKSLGFELLEEFPDLWGVANPCWQLIKAL